jgi:hypothetical protein
LSSIPENSLGKVFVTPEDKMGIQMPDNDTRKEMKKNDNLKLEMPKVARFGA